MPRCNFALLTSLVLCFLWAATARHCCSIEKTEKSLVNKSSLQDSGSLSAFSIKGRKYPTNQGMELTEVKSIFFFFPPGLKGGHTCCCFAFSFACANRLSPSLLFRGVKRDWLLARDMKLLALCRLWGWIATNHKTPGTWVLHHEDRK